MPRIGLSSGVTRAHASYAASLMRLFAHPASMKLFVLVAVSDGLPAGWASAVDPRYGIAYYFNAGTGQRQWQKPGAELPPGWQETRDPRSGLPYFFNLATGQRVWERPASDAAGAMPRLAPLTGYPLELKEPPDQCISLQHVRHMPGARCAVPQVNRQTAKLL